MTTLTQPHAATRRAPNAHTLVADVATRHGAELLSIARAHARNADDAHDAYQRAMELLLLNADAVDADRAVGWLAITIKREAWSLAKARHATVSLDDQSTTTERSLVTTDDERDDRIDLAERAGEALATLKDHEAHALCLRAQGLTYSQIADECGWTYTKVNRTVSEGRRAFAARFTALAQGQICDDVSRHLPAYLDDELSPRRAIGIRAHLVRCRTCRGELHAHRTSDNALRALIPPAAAGAGSTGALLDHLLGPLGHLLGRTQPALDATLGTKLGALAATAASAAALTGGATAVGHAEQTPVPKLTTALTSGTRPAAIPSPAADAGIVTQVDTALTRTTDLQRQADQARAERRAEARARARRNARRARARRAANRTEFSQTADEFTSTTSTATAELGATRATTGDTSTSTTSRTPTTADAPAAADNPPTIQLDTPDEPTIDVVELP